ncbi:MAG: hypothetical protein WDN08_05475 [Rhizomicrobium sp.]
MLDWAYDTFGMTALDRVERCKRVIEEAIEVGQAGGVFEEEVHRLVSYVYARPTGKLPREIGGLGIALLALAHFANIDAEAEEIREFERVLSLPTEHFRNRQNEKAAAGVAGKVVLP